MSHLRLWGSFGVLVALVVACQWWSCSHNPTVSAPEYRNWSDSATYVGMQACRECHASQYETFIQTGMGKSFGKANPKKSAAHLTGKERVYDPTANLWYHPYWRDSVLHILEYRLEGNDTVYRRDEPIQFIVGSGQHTNSHIIWRNGFAFQAPLTYYTQSKTWDLPPGFEHGHNSRWSRPIGQECMACHNSLCDFDTQSVNRFNTIELGIGCERCHGPGSLHMQEKKNGKVVDLTKDIDRTIVNPRKLSWERQIDVCQRCHLQGNAVLKSGKSFHDFRPGMKLSDFFLVFMPRTNQGEGKFIMASHAERLALSKCFVSSQTNHQPQLTCISCHNPHVSVQVTGKEIFNKPCLSCHHGGHDCKAPAEERKAKNDACVTCHMPRSGTTDIPHVTVTDHFIRVPKKSPITQPASYQGIRCVNNPNPGDSVTIAAFLASYEKSGEDHHQLDSADALLSETQKKSWPELAIYVNYLKNDWKGLWELEKNAALTTPDAWTCYRLGEGAFQQGRWMNALQWFQQAAGKMQHHPDFLNKEAAAYFSLQQPDKALSRLVEADQLLPHWPQTTTNLGYYYFLTAQFAQAEHYYLDALQADPDYVPALKNLLQLRVSQNNTTDAKRLIKRLLNLDPKNALYAQWLAELNGH